MQVPRRTRSLLLFSVLLAAVGPACNLGAAAQAEPSATIAPVADTPTPAEPTTPPTETTVPATPTIAHLVQPGEPPAKQYFLSDVSSGGTNQIQRAVAGDNFNRNRLERPFLAADMSYRPDLDLIRVDISLDDTWFYFTLTLYGAGSGPLTGPYAVELDLDADGRGDLMVRGSPVAGGEWTTDTVQIWSDANGDVGGATPMTADPPPGGDGYETLVFDQGVGDDPDAAWIRVAVIENTGVQFAVKRSAVGDGSFLWSAWADEGVNRVGSLDYNDAFTPAEAGSLQTALAAVAAVDNTCRMYYGFTPTGSEPGLCLVTGTVRNCSPHPMRMEPGGKMLTPFFDSGAILTNVQIGTYSFYDESTGGTLVLTATLTPGGTITITKTGLGYEYPCQ